MIGLGQSQTTIKSMVIIFFDSKGIGHKEFILASHAINPHTTVTFYGGCMKMRKDFAQDFSDKRTGCCVTIAHHLSLPFSPRNFLPKTI
jgi:hypothetical protein